MADHENDRSTEPTRLTRQGRGGGLDTPASDPSGRSAAPAHRIRSPFAALRRPGRLRTWAEAVEQIRFWLAQSLAGELTDGNGFCWYVVAFALGEVAYLGLPREPWLGAQLAVLAGLLLVLAYRRRLGQTHFAVSLAVMVSLGCTAGQVQSIRCAGPSFDRERTVTVTGWIEAEETVLKDATRITLRVASMTARRLPKDVIPDLITVTFRAGTPLFRVGDAVSFLARLRPLQGPVMPGGYDFARRAFFDGRGATGYALGKIRMADLGDPPMIARVLGRIADLRHAIAQRIRSALPGASGAIAAAMIVGEQRGIPDAESDALRMSGLTHIISISGLHMSLVASGVFAAIRLALALFPAIALAYPIKKWAACGALFAASFYMLLAGDAVAAERSYLMCAIMLLSIVFDRPAITMRNVGLSAAVLLARDPAQIVEPSFLMSYLAVMALIGIYDAWRQMAANRAQAGHAIPHGPIAATFIALARRAGAAMASSLIATVATASVIADQFFRGTPYGVLSNLLVLPVIDLAAMPAAVVACLAMPLGLEAYPLTVMGWAINFMNAVAFLAAGLPGGQGLIGRIHPWSNPLEISGLLWLCLWQREWRLIGIAPILLALGLAPFAPQPDVLISEDAVPIAARGADGELHIHAATSNRFTTSVWLTADAARTTPADPRAPLDPHLGDGWRCDSGGCIYTSEDTARTIRRRIAFVDDPEAFEEDCLAADVVVSKLAAPDYCAKTALVFDRTRLAQTGAVAIYFGDRLDTSRNSPETAAPTIRQHASDRVAAALPPNWRPWLASRRLHTRPSDMAPRPANDPIAPDPSPPPAAAQLPTDKDPKPHPSDLALPKSDREKVNSRIPPTSGPD